MKLKVTLHTAEERTGVIEDLVTGSEPAVWDREGDDHTEQVFFDWHDDDGRLLSSIEIDGDDWRKIEENDSHGLPRVRYWLERGIDLEGSTGAAIDGCDPAGCDGEAEARIDELTAERDALAKSHDELVQQITILLGQTIQGHHGITRYQALNALEVLKNAIPLVTTEPEHRGILRPSAAYVDNLIKLAS